jgi:translation initiation factor IF-2
MAKKRIHQIAKELDIASADILFHAKELGIEVKTASSGLTEEEEELVKLSLVPAEEEKVVEEVNQ